MSAGRPRKPTKIKKAQGTLQKCRENPAEPQPEIRLPEPPEEIRADPRALKEWQIMGPILEKMGVIAESDVTAFAAYCSAVSDLWQADEIVRAEGPVIRITTQYGESVKANPAVSMKTQALKVVKAFCSEFGLTPAARSKVSARPPENQAAKTAQKYLVH